MCICIEKMFDKNKVLWKKNVFVFDDFISKRFFVFFVFICIIYLGI